jgi:ADP-heptose:LPS heptosyltransferase
MFKSFFKPILIKASKFIIGIIIFLLPKKYHMHTIKCLLFFLRKLNVFNTYTIFNYANTLSNYILNSKIRIAISLSGGLGDKLISLAWIKEFYKNFNEKIDIDIFCYSNEMAYLSYMNSYIHKLYDNSLFNDNNNNYTLKIKLCHFILIVYTDYVSATTDKQFANFIKQVNDFNMKYHKYSFSEPFYDGGWANLCTLKGWNRWDELGVNNAIPFSRNTKSVIHLNTNFFSILSKYGLEGKKYITIHAEGDTNSAEPLKLVKIWPPQLWSHFCSLVKEYFPDIILVQLGSISTNSIKGTDLNLSGKTNLFELSILLKNSLLHVDNESGLVHMRYLLNGKSIVLFGPTPSEYFAYDNNINIISPKCTNCMWVTDNWAYQCLRDFSKAECMWAITPEIVYEAVSNYLLSIKEYAFTLTNKSLFSSTSLKGYQQLLDDFCLTCSIEKKSITESMYGPGNIYIDPSKQWEYPFVAENIKKFSDKNLKIADVGCGRGALTYYLAKKGHDVEAFDINYLWQDQGNPDIENQYFQFARTNGFKADFGSVYNIPSADNSYDIVTCISVFEHIPYKKFAIKEFLRVLRPGGLLILTFDFVEKTRATIEGARTEILDLNTLTELLDENLITYEEIFSLDSIKSSLNDIILENITIAPSMTVGGIVLQKLSI